MDLATPDAVICGCRLVFSVAAAALMVASIVARPHAQAACPCSIWPVSAVPGAVTNHLNAVELGVKFRSDSNGYITGLRFYKYQSKTRAPTSEISGQPPARSSARSLSSNEGASGWRRASFPSPIAITATTTYVVRSVPHEDGVLRPDREQVQRGR